MTSVQSSPSSRFLPSGRRRKPEKLHKLSRSPIVNHIDCAKDKVAQPPTVPRTKWRRLKDFLSSNSWAWICSYLKYALQCKYPFPTYANSVNLKKNGVYSIAPSAGSDAIRIAIAGDWANGTDEAHIIAGLMEKTNPDFTIHLGDVYYVGDGDEIAQNCFGKSMHGYDGVTWPHGTQGSFAMNGNHEMYANGRPYFQSFLNTLGIKGDSEGQLASFFCLETDYWRILAIDTGYNSVGIPILSIIPFVKQIPFVGGDCQLEKELIEWLRSVVKLQEHPKPTVVLSHHQYFSAFPDRNYTKPAKQLAEFFKKQEFIWLWGHEHRLAIYDKFTTPDRLTFYGRCIGHGGMPIELAEPDKSKAPLLLYDKERSHKLDDGTDVGENGFVNLTIQGAVLRLEYRDIKNTSLLVERFTGGTEGTLTYSFDDPGILRSA